MSYEITRQAWLKNQERFLAAAAGDWKSPFVIDAYKNREQELSDEEYNGLTQLTGYFETRQRRQSYQMINAAVVTITPLSRIIRPLLDILDIVGVYGAKRLMTLRILLQAVQQNHLTYWGWSKQTWLHLVKENVRDYQREHHAHATTRKYLFTACYLISGCVDFRPLTHINLLSFASLIFGMPALKTALEQVANELKREGKRPSEHYPQLMVQILLACGSPLLKAIQRDVLDSLYRSSIDPARRPECLHISQALVELSCIERPLERPDAVSQERRDRRSPARTPKKKPALPINVPENWLDLCLRWREAQDSNLTPGTRKTYYHYLLKIGRWLQHAHPDKGDPSLWTGELAGECADLVNSLHVGEWTHPEKNYRWAKHTGELLSQNTRDHYQLVLSIFFRDCAERGWITLHFDPGRYFLPSPPRTALFLDEI